MRFHRLLAGLALSSVWLASATAEPAAPAPAASSQPTAQGQDPAHVAVLTGDQVIQILDETVDWYRTLGAQQQTATQPSDLLILYANRQTADKVINLAFEIARANAELLSSEAGSAQAAATEAGSSPQALDHLQKRLEVQRQGLLSEMEAMRRASATAAQNARTETEAKLSELQGELDMLNARRNLLSTMTQFVTESDAKGASASALKAHIDAIAVSIPSANVNPPATGAAAVQVESGTAAATSAPILTTSAPSRLGIWNLGTNALRLSQKVSTIDAIDRRTAGLEQTFEQIRSKPLEQLKALSARGDALAIQADHANSATLKSVRDQFDTLAWLFQQTSAILLPLSKEGVLLKQYRHNLASWRDIIEHQYHEALAALGIRLLVLAAMLAAVFAAGEVWRRAVLRYAHEPRRRSQLLVFQRFTVWAFVLAIVAFTFVTELSSFATFAGLLTAGVAVAMQSVLVSLVGYFFLIGKYGVRVGDRVQIGTVTGEVIDLGLVRMHLMELNPDGPLGPTGRVVAFANSIVFQASGGLFKQIPGVNFTWHELTLSLPKGADFTALKNHLLATVSSIVQEYQDEIVRQTRQIEKSTASSSGGDATPQVQLKFSPSGVEAIVRYPVNLQRAAEIDERVSRELWSVISAQPVDGGKK